VRVAGPAAGDSVGGPPGLRIMRMPRSAFGAGQVSGYYWQLFSDMGLLLAAPIAALIWILFEN